MREDYKYYLPGGYIRGEMQIMCNGKIVNDNHIKEAWDNKTQSSSKNIYERVMLEVYCWLINES